MMKSWIKSDECQYKIAERDTIYWDYPDRIFSKQDNKKVRVMTLQYKAIEAAGGHKGEWTSMKHNKNDDVFTQKLF